MDLQAERAGHGECAGDVDPGEGHGLRILVADDDEGTRLLLSHLFEDEGFVVDVAENGRRAFDLATDVRPDVVLTDVQMPLMDGIELCRQLRELDPTMPVLVMTGVGAIPSAVAAMQAGALDYLTKPIEIDGALRGIRRALATRALNIERNQLRLQQQALLEEALTTVRAHEEATSIVAHDLRDPLLLIVWQATALSEAAEGLSAERLRDIGERVLRATARMKRLVSDLLDESRIRAGQMTLERKRVRVRDVLRDMAELRPLAWQARVALQVEGLQTAGVVYADRIRLGQVLANLITNAIKFSRPGGTVALSVADSGPDVCFSVTDAGPGIAEADRCRLFEPFWQGGPKRKEGVGLGLYIAKTIVEAHGGRIELSSELGRGTQFRVLIPADVSEMAPSLHETES